MGTLLRRCLLLTMAVTAAVVAEEPPPVPAVLLQPGTPVSRSLAAGQEQRYEVRAARGQSFRLRLERHGVGVVLTLTGPDGSALIELAEAEANGAIAWVVVAEQDGPQRVTLTPYDHEAVGGTYEIGVSEPQPATARDREVYRADIAEGRISVLLNQDTAEAVSSGAAEAERAVEYARALRDDARLAKDLNVLGGIRSLLNDEASALRLWKEAVESAGRAGASGEEALGWVNLGFGTAVQGNLAGGVELIAKGAELARAAGARREEIIAEMLLSTLYSLLGDKQRSLDRARHALELARAAHESDCEPHLLKELGLIYGSLGHNRRAVAYFEAAVAKMRTTRQPRPVGALLSNIGALYLDLERVSEGLARLQEALQLQRRSGSLSGQAATLAHIGRAYRLQGNLDASVDAFKEALSLTERMEFPVGRMSVVRGLAGTYLRQKRFDEAAAHYDQVLALARQTKSPTEEGLALVGLAETAEARGRLAEATTQVEAGLAVLETVRRNPAEASARASFLAQMRRFYTLGARILMGRHREEPEVGHDRAAFAMSERGRARALLDSMVEPSYGTPPPRDAAAEERAHRLRQEVEAQAKRITAFGRGATDDERRSAHQELERLLGEEEAARAETRPRGQAPNVVAPAALAFEAVQELLDADTVLLEYMLGKDGGLVFAVTRSGLASGELPGSAEIEEKVRRLRALLAARKERVRFETTEERARRLFRADAEAERLAGEMSELLLRPVAPQLTRRRVVVVADGLLHYLPFAALPAPGSVPALALIERHEVVHLPSASVLAMLRTRAARRTRPPKTVAVLADPVFEGVDPRVHPPAGAHARDARAPATTLREIQNSELRAAIEASSRDGDGLQRLPGTRREAQSILALVPAGAAHVALDFDASRANALRPGLVDFRLVHFATHGYVDGRDPRLSGLVLSLVDRNGAPQDGFLRLPDVYSLTLNAELVTLSACETALGEEINGEGLVGLSHAFLQAGAQRVLATLWRVDDDATAELMGRFYRAILKDGLPPADALRQAQQAVRRQPRWRAPYYWAGVTLQGEPR
jgi:CHAT domain-containing protein/tetratricopeptide (TPR) repeat protein